MRLAVRTSVVIVLVLLVAPVAWLSMSARPASACSVDPQYDPVANAYAVVLGRIEGFDPVLPGDFEARAPMRVTVERTLSGATQPATIEVLTRVRRPGVPMVCLELDPAGYAGQRAVIALYSQDGSERPGNGGGLDVWIVDSHREGVGIAQLSALYHGTYQPVAPGPPNVGTGLARNTRPDGGRLLGAGALLAAAGLAAWRKAR